MKKRVLILSASPRKKGNSDQLCDQFLRGALNAGHEAEKLFLRGHKIAYCTGCGKCFGTGQCSQKDDMAEILEKMVAADVIVMATPIYFYTMNGLLKTVIDRACPKYTEISGKDFYFIMTAADDTKDAMQRALTEFEGFTSCLESPTVKGVVYGTGVWHVGEIEKHPAMQEAYTMGQSC